MSNRYDIAIVGTGPAGLSAALNAKIRKKSLILFGSNNLSSKVQKATKINNYLGFPSSSGVELAKAFKNHIKEMEINITEERINNIYAMGDYFVLMVNEKVYEAKTIILATGVEFTKPIKGENEFLGRGVGYCATCDAPLYKEKIVTIISSNADGENEANYVNSIASKVNYVPLYKAEYRLDKDIDIFYDKPIEIVGNESVSKLILTNNEIETDGVFLFKDAISPSQLVPGLKEVDGHIEVNSLMETNIKGCFAAGDCVGKPYQYIKAAGEGNIAALSAVNYLDKVN